MATDTKNFKVSEFACHCGCDYNVIDQRVINMAQTIREALGVPVRINSGCRCEENNARAGGVKGSYHTKGLAADLACILGSGKMFETIKALQKEGKLPDLSWCKRYRKKNFCHIDCGRKRNVMFVEGD
ncbi:MAG: hypothetical protein IJP85_01070 [Synergistaceae bacterium]|nr:hypothetical protein [Synergistaceae bacterium]